MDIRTGILVCTLLAGCIALTTLEGPEDDLSLYFDDTDVGLRISGGDEAPIGKYPYMVALTTGVSVKTFICGASLITQRTILSAAHCLQSKKDPVNTIHGTVGTNRWNSGGTTYAFSRIVEYPNPRSGIIRTNDLCLFITATNVVFTERVQPVALSFEFVPPGVTCKVAGWGSPRSDAEVTDTLMELTTTTLIMPDCAVLWAAYPPPINIETNICTLSSPGHGFCYGDSGGALIRADSGEQIGIVSWMAPCARGFPDVFARISAYETWIKANTVW